MFHWFDLLDKTKLNKKREMSFCMPYSFLPFVPFARKNNSAKSSSPPAPFTSKAKKEKNEKKTTEKTVKKEKKTKEKKDEKKKKKKEKVEENPFLCFSTRIQRGAFMYVYEPRTDDYDDQEEKEHTVEETVTEYEEEAGENNNKKVAEENAEMSEVVKVAVKYLIKYHDRRAESIRHCLELVYVDLPLFDMPTHAQIEEFAKTWNPPPVDRPTMGIKRFHRKETQKSVQTNRI